MSPLNRDGISLIAAQIEEATREAVDQGFTVLQACEVAFLTGKAEAFEEAAQAIPDGVHPSESIRRTIRALKEKP